MPSSRARTAVHHVAGRGGARRAVMALRYDPQAVGGDGGRDGPSDRAAYLRGRVGRGTPTGGELYMAHFLGPQGSARLIEANGASPGVSAASLFPEAATANRMPCSTGTARRFRWPQVYAGLARTGGDGAVVGTRRIACNWPIRPATRPPPAHARQRGRTDENARSATDRAMAQRAGFAVLRRDARPLLRRPA